MQEFKVTEYITLKLEEYKTVLYVNGERFRHCMQLVFRIPEDQVYAYNTIDSIDEAAEMYENKILRELKYEDIKINPEEEFLAHCSNLQAWVEYDYDTRLLHSELAFPLLRELFQLNEPKAKKVFKDEIAERFVSGYPSVVESLLNQGYLDYLNAEEINVLFQDFNLDLIIKQKPDILITLYKKFVRLGAFEAKKIILQEITDRFFDEDPLTMGPLFKLQSEFFELIEQEKEWSFSHSQSLEMSLKTIYKTKFLYNLKHGDYSIVKTLILSNYILSLNRDKINNLFKNFDYDHILKEDLRSAPLIFERLIKLQAPNAKKFYRNYVFEKFDSGDNSIIAFLLRYGYLWELDRNDLPILFDKIDYEYILEQEDAFNLLKFLKCFGASNAEKWYKQCIAKLIRTGFDFYNTSNEIIKGLLNEYNIEFITTIFEGYDYAHIAEQYFDIAPMFFEKLVGLGLREAKEFYESENFLKKILINEEIPFFLDLCSRLDSPIRMDRPNIDWTRNYLWPPGITIVDKRIIDLNLRGCNLNEIPDTIGRLTQLKKMNLSKNKLISLPSSMSNLKLLKELDLSHNQFNKFPSIISQLKYLEKLSLKINSIEEVPDTVSEFSSLRLLDLRKNNLKILPKSLSNFKNLTYLGLSFNNLNSIPENIHKLESLEVLVCDYNNLKALPETIGDLMKLKVLDVDGNPLISLPKSILEINSLKNLSVNLKHMDESGYSIINLLSDNKVNICSPPYTIDFYLYGDESYFSPLDENTQKKFSRYINPDRLPLTMGVIDKLDGLYRVVYGLRPDEITPELCSTIFETFEEVKNQLKPNFKVIFDEHFKMELLNQIELDHYSGQSS
ncbi:MAG: leucine-rich repeat domain-containing protein [Promethearchaeota archaeon]|nr:MAG: leucine-rich repeat domain-containing protein [Candidatus Lokiarchaeota archaeon]